MRSGARGHFIPYIPYKTYINLKNYINYKNYKTYFWLMCDNCHRRWVGGWAVLIASKSQAKEIWTFR